jgi:hypothetical protein
MTPRHPSGIIPSFIVRSFTINMRDYRNFLPPIKTECPTILLKLKSTVKFSAAKIVPKSQAMSN